MRIEPLGDSAYLLRDLQSPAFSLASAIEGARIPGVVEAVASYDTVGVYVEEGFDPTSLASIVAPPAEVGRMHTLPVCYELGEDLAEAAERLALAPSELIERHAGRPYRCYALGFCPGFPYLGELDDRIATLPRRSSPRVRVTPGSVAITGRQTGVYPLERPGGWWLIGRTPLTLVDLDDDYFPIAAGDQVRFQPISPDEYQARLGERL